MPDHGYINFVLCSQDSRVFFKKRFQVFGALLTGQGIQTKQNLWKAVFKKFVVIWSPSADCTLFGLWSLSRI